MSSWKEGQCPDRVWLERKDVGAHISKIGLKKGKRYKTRLWTGRVNYWAVEPVHRPGEYVEYRLVRRKRK
jgi:hypothetical protein